MMGGRGQADLSKVLEGLNEAIDASFEPFDTAQNAEEFCNAKRRFEANFYTKVINPLIRLLAVSHDAGRKLLLKKVLSHYDSHLEKWENVKNKCFPQVKTLFSFSFDVSYIYSKLTTDSEQMWLNDHTDLIRGIINISNGLTKANNKSRAHERLIHYNNLVIGIQNFHLAYNVLLKKTPVYSDNLIKYGDNVLLLKAPMASKLVAVSSRLIEILMENMMGPALGALDVDQENPLHDAVSKWIDDLYKWLHEPALSFFKQQYQDWYDQYLFVAILSSARKAQILRGGNPVSLTGVAILLEKTELYLRGQVQRCNKMMESGVAQSAAMDEISGILNAFVSSIEFACVLIQKLDKFDSVVIILSEAIQKFDDNIQGIVLTLKIDSENQHLWVQNCGAAISAIRDSIAKKIAVEKAAFQQMSSAARMEDTEIELNEDYSSGEAKLQVIFDEIDKINIREDGMAAIDRAREKLLKGNEKEILAALMYRGHEMRKQILSDIDRNDMQRAELLLNDGFIRKIKVMFHTDKSGDASSELAKSICQEVYGWLVRIRGDISSHMNKNEALMRSVDDLINFKASLARLDDKIAVTQASIDRVTLLQSEQNRLLNEIDSLLDDSLKPNVIGTPRI